MTETCPLCYGSGWTVRELAEAPVLPPHASDDEVGRLKVTAARAARAAGHQPPPSQAVRCACWTAKVTAQRLAAAEIPVKYQHCTFDTFTAYNERLERALSVSRALAAAFPVAPSLPGFNRGKGLLLHGQAGVGKTHLAISVLKAAILQTNCRGLFAPVRDLLKRIRDSYNPTTMTAAGDILTPALTCDLLVLDDMGAERTTDWVDETMNLIVDTRYRENRLTLFTTNLDDVPDDTEPNSLLFRIGYRMRSRLYEMAEFLEMDGADYRNRPPDHDVEDLRMLHKQRKKALPETGHGKARQARAALRGGDPRQAELKWSGGRGGNT